MRFKGFYTWTRDLHLYLGLFISPFVLLFAASVFFLNHAKVAVDVTTSEETVQGIQLPDVSDGPQNMERVAAAKKILDQLRVTGEIGFVQYQRKERRLVIPVSKPGLETKITVDLDTRSASTSRRTTGFWEALAYLHKMPGPHNAAIRGNWIGTRAWQWFADGTIYSILFITASGLYLWFSLRAERRIGVMLLAAGAVSFIGAINAILR
jgi:hypothetical protein